MRYVSSLVTQGSGSLGNLVVEKNGVIRNRNIPSNPNTVLQAAVRATLTSLSTAWRDHLTDTQRANWNAYAATLNRKDTLGKTLKVSGISAFVGGNCALIQGGEGPAVDDAPSTTGSLSLPAVTNVVADDSANTIAFTFAAAVPNTTFVSLFLSPANVSPGRSSYAGPYRYVTTTNGSGTTTITYAHPVTATGVKLGWRIIGFTDDAKVSADQTGLVKTVA